MDVVLIRRSSFAPGEVARKACIAGFTLIVAAALASCDSRDAGPNTGGKNPSGTENIAAETDTSGGEPVVFSQEELSSEYLTLTGLVAEAADTSIWRRFRAQQQAKIAFSGERMVVNVTGDNPILIMPAFAAGQRFIIETLIEADKDTLAQLYYLTPGQTKYSEEQSQIVELKAGRNVVYFRLDDPNVIDPLRFDPASAPGTYTIERMTARALPPDAE